MKGYDFFIHWRGIEDTRWTKLNISLLLPTEQVIKLVGGAHCASLRKNSNSMTYRIEVKYSKAHGKRSWESKNFLKEDANILKKNNELLFCRKSSSHIKETKQSKKQIPEIIREIPSGKWKMRWKKLLPHTRRKIVGAVSGNVSQQIEKNNIVFLSS